jgi:hypothetical protein
LRSVGIVASDGLFYVTAQPRTGDRITLATTRGRQMRGFRDAGKAIAILHAIGARKVEVDISDWSPAQESDMARRRPDAGERKRRADEADGYDAWFRAEIERSLREADSPDAVWVSQEDVRQESAVRRSAWLNRAEADGGHYRL